jgi:hypothetical protein
MEVGEFQETAPGQLGKFQKESLLLGWGRIKNSSREGAILS